MSRRTLRRDESVADWALGLAPWLPPPLRRPLARRAAARGLGAAALRACDDDPVVLARLGMVRAAVAATGGGRSGGIARTAAAAAMGDLEPVRRLIAAGSVLSLAERRFVAANVAPSDAGLAYRLLPDVDHADRAACALAAGDLDVADQCIDAAGESPSRKYLAAAVASWRGDWRATRRILNEAFAGEHLAAPLAADSALPTTLEMFTVTATLPAIDGPLVSVVMAARDAERTLAIAVRSLAAQTWRNLDLIIVDDRSTDETRAIALRMAAADARIRVLANTRSEGAYGARNTGISAARGAFVALHDADDWAHPQRLERQMRAIGSDKALTVGRYFRLDPQGRLLCPRVFPFIRVSPIATLARAEIWESVGLFDEVPVGADSEWWARVHARWGRRAAPRTPGVGMVALWESRSLSAAPATGLAGEGLARRIAYLERWRRRHAGLAED